MSSSSNRAESEQKYDRQLRLWGPHGQARLEAANLCLLTADAVGAETLKNLILPCVGKWTIVDDAVVGDIDFSTSFFVERSSAGKPRAVEVTRLLQELNPDSIGKAVVANIANTVKTDIGVFDQFTHVIASNVDAAVVNTLGAYLWSKSIPLFIIKTNGFFGYFRIVKEEHNVIETKIDNAVEDLRVSNPFPKLLAAATAQPLEAMDNATHSHFPWVLVLIAFSQKWRQQHGGKLPQNSAEKKQFKQSVRELARGSHEENMLEAYTQAHVAYAEYKIPNDVATILSLARARFANGEANDARTAGTRAANDHFWRLAYAVALFVDGVGNGALPLAGSVPDLTATTEGYLALQKLYQEKAVADAHVVFDLLQKHFGESVAQSIGQAAVSDFCRNVATLKHVPGRSLADERGSPILITNELNDKTNEARWLLLFRAASTIPSNIVDGESKRNALIDAVRTELKSEGADSANLDDCVAHWLRSNGSQMHNTAAVVGGIASQEIIKVITLQYVPIDNVLIWNGITSHLTVLKQ